MKSMKEKARAAAKKVLHAKESSKKCKTERGSALTQRKVLRPYKSGKFYKLILTDGWHDREGN